MIKSRQRDLMFKTRGYQLLGMVVPILILLAVSMYFTYTSVEKYLSSKKLKEHMSQTKVLLVLEASLSNELVCTAVMGSDAFFPFRDAIDVAHEAGITAVIQPGGSKRDKEVIEAVDEHNMSMVFTGYRVFKH